MTSEVPTIGIIGVGTMGGGMARNLLAAGYSLTVCDLDQAKVNPLVTAGASQGPAPSDVVAGSQITLTSLPTSSTFIQAMETEGTGMLAGISAGKVIIDTGTTSVPETLRLEQKVKDAGGDMLDAPVSGGGGGADAGTLAVMVGGEDEIFAHCRPILDVIGGNIVHVGGIGAGQIVKAVNQIAMGVGEAAFLEAMFLGVRAGLDPEKVREALKTAGAVNTSFAGAAKTVVDHRAESRDLKLRELPYFVEAAKDLGVNLPLTEALLAFVAEAEDRTTDPLGIPTPSYWHELMNKRRSQE